MARNVCDVVQVGMTERLRGAAGEDVVVGCSCARSDKARCHRATLQESSRSTQHFQPVSCSLCAFEWLWPNWICKSELRFNVIIFESYAAYVSLGCDVRCVKLLLPGGAAADKSITTLGW